MYHDESLAFKDCGAKNGIGRRAHQKNDVQKKMLPHLEVCGVGQLNAQSFMGDN